MLPIRQFDVALGLMVVLIVGVVVYASNVETMPPEEAAVTRVQTHEDPDTVLWTREEVATHNTSDSCYTVINESVYDLSGWITAHPGGSEAILRLCGIDGTDAFRAQHGGQVRPEETLDDFKIGELGTDI